MTQFRGAIFDIDGVMVDSPHELAWRESLRELMEGPWASIRPRTTWSPEAFTSRVYQLQLSGKPRLSGALSALAHFGVPDPQERAVEYGEHKQAKLLRLIDAGDFTAFPDALRFILRVKEAGLRVAAASSSKNAYRFLRRIRLDEFVAAQGRTSPVVTPGLTLLELFDADVSGRNFGRGKPDPEMFLTAASELGVDPADAFVVEDAPSGVVAAKAGGMAALGIARADDAELLAGAGADVVVTTLDDVDLDALGQGRLAVAVR